MESSQWENYNHLFCRKVSFLTDHRCHFRGVGQGMKQTYLYLWYPLFQDQCDRCYEQNHQTLNYLIKVHHLFSEREIKGSGYLLFVFYKPLYETLLIWTKEQVGKKRNTVVINRRYADCLLKNTSTKHNKYVGNKKNSSILMISFSENFLVESE
jgi:hypothetical protein